MPDWTFYRHSGIHACPLSRYLLHYQSCAVCPCPCCLSMSIMHVHVHDACPCQCCMSMAMSMYIYIEMLEYWTVRRPVSPVPNWKKLMMPEQARYWTKVTQSGIFLVRYRTKIRDAGMPMPALVSSMLMPSYANFQRACKSKWPRTGSWRSRCCPWVGVTHGKGGLTFS